MFVGFHEEMGTQIRRTLAVGHPGFKSRKLWGRSDMAYDLSTNLVAARVQLVR
jgi:hypothetical protein